MDDSSRRISDPDTLARLDAIVIPPASTDVWICPDPLGHLQATGRDARGRKVYRYHPDYRAHRDARKYDMLPAFAAALPAIREQVERDLARPCHDRRHTLALVVDLLQWTHIRVGNDRYAKDHAHFGLTTLRRKHVRVNGSTVHFTFTGKSGKEHDIALSDPRLARAVRRCQDLPGHELFKYLDEEGERRRVGSGDVNTYLRELSGEDYTAKHFRTWAGTVTAAVVLREMEPTISEKEKESNLVAAVKATAAHLGNTPTTCRKFYIHPRIFDAYRGEWLTPTLVELLEKVGPQAHEHHMWPEEAAVLALLQAKEKASR